MSEDGELFSDLPAQWEQKWRTDPASAHELGAEHAERAGRDAMRERHSDWLPRHPRGL
ncbi:hypothetical protein OG242_27625 [Streptomyces sp. NBC_00727]|uniref:hypothetical protein n=1 Tax=Streptomyces sp. NBC_00727 TaxID=2903675 RepID=UPI00386F7C5D